MEQMKKWLLLRCTFRVAATAIFISYSIGAGVAEEAPALPCPMLNLPLANSNELVQSETELGYTDLLLGWEEQACMHFAKAIEEGERAGEPCLMAYCGMMLAVPERGAKDAARLALLENIDVVGATPIELFYINSFLKLLEGDIAGAAKDFDARATKYRRDAFSRCWAIMLLHCADVGYDMLGRPQENQARALALAEEQYRNASRNGLYCYLRAYIEESAPTVSEEALHAASCAVQMMPEHPMPALLYGHLLYKNRQGVLAIQHLSRASELSSHADIPVGRNRLRILSALYEATALWTHGDRAKAAAAEKMLLTKPINQLPEHSPEGVLIRWEAHSFLLRKYILSPQKLDAKALRTMLKELPTIPKTEDKEALLHYRECLKAALYACARMQNGDKQHAQQSLKLAKEELLAFEETRDAVFRLGAEYYTPWQRAKEACEIAVLFAGAEVFPDPGQFWKTVMDSTVRPATMLMPPVLPVPASE